MKSLTLQRLLVSLEDTRRYHAASALFETDPERQSRARQHAHRASSVLDAIHFELSAREAGDRRSADEARRADSYLQRLLEEFLDLGELERKWTPASAFPGPSSTMPHAGTGGASIPSRNAEGS